MEGRRRLASILLALFLVTQALPLSVPPAVFAAGGGSAGQANALQNPVTAGPPISKPSTPSCTVTLLEDAPFAKAYAPFVGSYAPPPSCPGPWAKVILDWNGTVSGTQFDRIGAVWLGLTEVFRTSTPEPPGSVIAWHVSKDVSEYAPILSEPQNVTVIISNSVSKVDTGVIYVNATLTFYEAGGGFDGAPHPDLVVPVASTAPAGYSAPWVVVDSGGSASSSLDLPTNIVRAYLEVYATAHSCDEAWYGNQTTDYADDEGLCGGTAFREIQVSIDGRLAGVVWPFPYIYTGGWNPYLWETIPGIDAFNIPPYVVNLTPFASILDDGSPHTVSISVLNDFDYWRIDANLLLYTDHSSQSDGGALTSYTVAQMPNEEVDETVGGVSQTLSPSAAFRCSVEGEPICLFTTTASRSFLASGYVETSAGRVTTTINQSMAFSNVQTVDLADGLEDLQGSETTSTATTIVNGSGTFVETVEASYPLGIASAELVPTDTARPVFILPAAVNQTLLQNATSTANGRVAFSSTFSDVVQAHAVWEGNLTSDANILVTGETTEHYVYEDSTPDCFDQTLSAMPGIVVADTSSNACG